MSKLIKKLENGTDFMVCIHEMNSGKFVVTIYDHVNRTHEKQGAYDDYNEALSVAKSLNDQYKIDENTVKLNESQLRKIVADSVKKVLKEGRHNPTPTEVDVVKTWTREIATYIANYSQGNAVRAAENALMLAMEWANELGKVSPYTMLSNMRKNG